MHLLSFFIHHRDSVGWLKPTDKLSSQGMESPQRKRKAQDADPASTEKQRRVDTVDPEVGGSCKVYKGWISGNIWMVQVNGFAFWSWNILWSDGLIRRVFWNLNRLSPRLQRPVIWSLSWRSSNTIEFGKSRGALEIVPNSMQWIFDDCSCKKTDTLGSTTHHQPKDG